MTTRFHNLPTNPWSVVVFDIECDGLAELSRKSAKSPLQPEVSQFWCGVVQCCSTGEILRFRPHELEQLCHTLNCANVVIGHNIIDYDIRVLGRLCPSLVTDGLLMIDTLVIARYLMPDRDLHPFTNGNGNGLAAWGDFLGFPKIDFHDFSAFSEEMLTYCVQDVNVSLKLWEFLRQHIRGQEEGLEREHRVAEAIAEQTEVGVAFDLPRARRLQRRLTALSTGIDTELQRSFPPRIEEMKGPAYYSAGIHRFRTIGEAKLSGFKRSEITASKERKTKQHPFNPDSRQQIADRFRQKYGWKPEQFTDGGKPKVDEKVLESLPYPEASLLAKRMMLGKRLGQLKDWIERAEQSRDGRIHGSVNIGGTATGRMTHSQPNLAQVPASRKPFGRACRSLFTAREGCVLVGCDAAGLELRMLAHRMWEYDNGEYAKIVVDGDVHTANQHAAGLAKRDDAKTFIYAFLYGAGASKLGSIVGGGYDEGAALKDKFLKSYPALGHLIQRCQTDAMTKGYIQLLDGRWVPVRSEHAALNTQLQGDGAIVMKEALVVLDEWLKQGDYGARFVLNVHDEFQLEVREDKARYVALMAEEAIEQAGINLGVKCPLAGNADIGKNWRRTH